MAWDLTRRSFTAGLGGVVSRFVAGPVAGGRPVSPTAVFRPEIDDAYERLLSEYVRIEEAAIAAGRTTGGGATTFVGRQLETFIGDLDSGVDLGVRAGEIYDRFRARLREAVERMARHDEAVAQTPSEAELDDIDCSARTVCSLDEEAGDDPAVVEDAAQAQGNSVSGTDRRAGN